MPVDGHVVAYLRAVTDERVVAVGRALALELASAVTAASGAVALEPKSPSVRPPKPPSSCRRTTRRMSRSSTSGASRSPGCSATNRWLARTCCCRRTPTCCTWRAHRCSPSKPSRRDTRASSCSRSRRRRPCCRRRTLRPDPAGRCRRARRTRRPCRPARRRRRDWLFCELSTTTLHLCELLSHAPLVAALTGAADAVQSFAAIAHVYTQLC